MWLSYHSEHPIHLHNTFLLSSLIRTHSRSLHPINSFSSLSIFSIPTLFLQFAIAIFFITVAFPYPQNPFPCYAVHYPFLHCTVSFPLLFGVHTVPFPSSRLLSYPRGGWIARRPSTRYRTLSHLQHYLSHGQHLRDDSDVSTVQVVEKLDESHWLPEILFSIIYVSHLTKKEFRNASFILLHRFQKKFLFVT